MAGTPGKDKIIGSEASEVLAGFSGKDKLKGHGGADGFLLDLKSKFAKSNVDIIQDFNPQEGDMLLVKSSKVFKKSDDVSLSVVDNKSELRKARATDVDFVYHEERKYGLLYFNENGDDNGFGKGGLRLILRHAPELTTANIDIF